MCCPARLGMGLITVALLVEMSVVTADSWPGWQGPNRDNISPDTGLLKKWPENGPPLKWKASGLGGGYSNVAVVDGKIYTMGQVGAPTGGYGAQSAKRPVRPAPQQLRAAAKVQPGPPRTVVEQRAIAWSSASTSRPEKSSGRRRSAVAIPTVRRQLMVTDFMASTVTASSPALIQAMERSSGTSVFRRIFTDT